MGQFAAKNLHGKHCRIVDPCGNSSNQVFRHPSLRDGQILTVCGYNPNKDLYTKFTLAYAAFDDWLLVQINGHTVYVGPYGGDRLEKVQRCSERGDRGTVCDNYIQYGPNSFGGYELDTNWAFNLNVDLRPYLQAGQNTIFMRTLVAGNGEGAIRIDANSCLAEE